MFEKSSGVPLVARRDVLPSGGGVRSRAVACAVLTALLGAGLAPGSADRAWAAGSSSGPASELGRELVSSRTRTSRTYEDAQGALTSRVYPGSVNYRAPDGSWKAIDNTVVATTGGFANKAGHYSVKLPSRLGGGPVTVSREGSFVSFDLVGARAAGRAAGSSVTYPSAFKGVDARYDVGSDALKETLVLASRQSQRSFAFRLGMSAGLTPKLQATGGVSFEDNTGRVVSSFAAPFMVDAAGVRSRAVDFGLVRDAKGWKLTTTASAAWLEDPARRYPVRVDPYASPLADPDCGLDEDAPESATGCTDRMRLGRDGAGKEHRVLMRFGLDEALPFDADVISAGMRLNVASQTDATAEPASVAINRVTRSWSQGASWNRHDGVSRWGSPGGDYDDARNECEANCNVGGTDGTRAFYSDITALARRWSTGATNHGVLVRDASARANVMSIVSTDTYGDDPYQGSFLDVRYTRRVGEKRGYNMQAFKLNDRIDLKVNAANGNLLATQNDLAIPGALGPDVEVGRTYNSLQPSNSGSYGPNWTMGTASGISLDSHGGYNQYLHTPSGHIAFFKIRYEDGGYKFTTPAGFDATLSRDQDGGHTLTEHQSQTKYKFENGGPDRDSRLISVTDRNGRALKYAYEPNSRRVSRITDSQDRVTSFTWNSEGRVSGMTDPAGRSHGYTYTASGQLHRSTDPAGGVTCFEYSGSAMTKITTPAGRQTKIAYYPAGDEDHDKVQSITRVTNEAEQTGPTTRFSYVERRDGSSDAYVEDPSRHETKYIFNDQGFAASVTDANDNTQKMSYTANANVQSYSAPGSSTGSANLTRSFDNDGNLTATSAPTTTATDGPALTTANAFPAGQTTGGGTVAGGTYLPASSTDEQGKQTAYAYDGAGNPSAITQQGNASASVSFEYSSTVPGRLDGSRDGLGRLTSYGYDAKGNLTSVAPPSASIGQTSISYSGHGGADQALSRISSITRPVAGTETYDYDALDRVTKVSYPDGHTVSSSYDLDGNLIEVRDSAAAAGTRTLTYDKLNRLTAQAGPGSAYVNYGYDPTSNLTSVQDSNGTTEYGYDAANRNISVYEPGVSAPVKFGLDVRGNRTKTTLPNGVITEQSFNEAGQLLRTCSRPGSLTDACSSSTPSRLLDFAYTYRHRQGAAGQPMRAEGLQATVTDKDDRLTRHCYDDLNRVTRVETATTTTPPAGCVDPETGEDPGPGSSSSDWWTYGFDLAGNITGSERKDAAPQSFAYAEGNRLCWKTTGPSSNTCDNPPSGATTYTHDAAGQETATSGGGRQSSYNARQQLTAFTGVSGIEYFGTGQSELTSASGDIHRSSALGLGQIGPDTYTRDEFGTLLSQNTTRGREYTHLDALGSVRATTDSTGNVNARLDYDPYGQPTSTQTPGPSTSRFGYAQGESIAGLYHYGERHYDPSLMRWTQPDPLLNADDIRQVNRYAYVGGDPVNFTDPDGEFAFLVARVVVAKVAPKVVPRLKKGACVVLAACSAAGPVSNVKGIPSIPPRQPASKGPTAERLNQRMRPGSGG